MLHRRTPRRIRGGGCGLRLPPRRTNAPTRTFPSTRKLQPPGHARTASPPGAFQRLGFAFSSTCVPSLDAARRQPQACFRRSLASIRKTKPSRCKFSSQSGSLQTEIQDKHLFTLPATRATRPSDWHFKSIPLCTTKSTLLTTVTLLRTKCSLSKDASAARTSGSPF